MLARTRDVLPPRVTLANAGVQALPAVVTRARSIVRWLPVVAATLALAPAAARAQSAASTSRGVPSVDDRAPAGRIEVALVYDETTPAVPSTGVAVVLVGYAATERITVVRAKTNRTGVATFTGLDTTGAVAYYALAALPRNGKADRLVSRPITLRDHGVRVTLVAASRTSPATPIDDTPAEPTTPASAVPVGAVTSTVRVVMGGLVVPNTPIEIRDAATGKLLAQGTSPMGDLIVNVPARPGQVVYATAVYGKLRAWSAPVQAVADRGIVASLYLLPRILPTLDFAASADDASLMVFGYYRLANNSWFPYASAPGGYVLPVPRGAMAISSREARSGDVVLDAGGAHVRRALPPGNSDFALAFDLPAVQRSVAWSLELPDGAWKSRVRLEQEPGATLEQLPAGVAATAVTNGGSSYLVLEDLSLPPKQTMTLTVRLPPPTPRSATLHACRALSPDPSPLVGKTLPPFTLTGLDGKAWKLASLRGRPVLLNAMATWDQLSPVERPTLAALAKAVPGVAIVMVASDADPAAVGAALGPKPPFQVLLDPPLASPDNHIGPLTTSWGIKALPESLLLDRAGVVRYHFQNSRDWSTSEAWRCVAALVAEH